MVGLFLPAIERLPRRSADDEPPFLTIARFQHLVQADVSNGSVEYPFPADSHRAVEAWLAEYPETARLLGQFADAASHPQLPPLEKEYVREELAEVSELFEEIREHLLHRPLSTSDVSQARGAIWALEQTGGGPTGPSWQTWVRQRTTDISALLRAIQERGRDDDEGKVAREMHLKLAQHAVDELLQEFVLLEEKIAPDVSFRDVAHRFETHEDFLIAGLRGEPWSEATLQVARKKRQAWKASQHPLLREVYASFSVIWREAKGSKWAPKTSILEILDLRDEALEVLAKRGVHFETEDRQQMLGM